jgi:hypothetical protein
MDSRQLLKNRNQENTVLVENTVGLSSIIKFMPKYYLLKEDILILCQISISEWT